MKTDTLYKRAFNDALGYVRRFHKGDTLPSETAFASTLGVSRTTVRKVFATLTDQGIVRGSGRHRVMGSTRQKVAPYPVAETVPTLTQVETQFMEWMLRGDAKPGSAINELDLARQFGVATTVIREFLNSFNRFGLIEKRTNGGWVLQGFTIEFALDLFEIREMFELRSAKAFAALPDSSPLWASLRAIRGEHAALLREIDGRFHDFSDLDNRFHRLINSASPNRFIDDFYDIISLVFHYHYQWNKQDERQRNEVAIREHLRYIDALLQRKVSGVTQACRAHLASARETLVRANSAQYDGQQGQAVASSTDRRASAGAGKSSAKLTVR